MSLLKFCPYCERENIGGDTEKKICHRCHSEGKEKDSPAANDDDND